jgi:predicted amidohydrolase
MGTTIRVAAVQMEPILGQVGRNLGRIVAGLEHAAREGAKLAVFPECALSGYGFASREDGYAHAVAVDGPEVAAIAEVAARTGCGCVFGFLEKDGAKLYNACALVGPGGVVGTYRKIHLPYLGIDMHVDPGDRPLAVHEINGLRVGVQICYDGSFPEASRVLALLGADLIALPTNWPTSAECAAEHMIPTRAMENTVYVMAVNRVGVESGFRFIGASSIADPAGHVVAKAGDSADATLFAEIDPEKSRTKRLVRVPGRHEINRFADRRPAFYGPLVEPNGR